MWEHDGEEHIETEAAGWSGQLVYVRVPDRRHRFVGVVERGRREAAIGNSVRDDDGPDRAIGRAIGTCTVRS